MEENSEFGKLFFISSIFESILKINQNCEFMNLCRNVAIF